MPNEIFDLATNETASVDGGGGGLVPIFVQPGTRQFPLGSDISGVRAIDLALTTVSGRRALAEAILRRLTTPRGGLVGSPAYGYDVLSTIGSTVPPSIVEQRVLEQVLAEEEVADARCTAAFNASIGAMTILVDVEDAEGPFELTLTRDQLTVQAWIDGVSLFEETT